MAEDDNLSPKDLRERLEETLRQNRELTEKLAVHEVKGVLEGKGFDLVKPEDLKGVPLQEVEAKAEAIQKDRLELQKQLTVDALTKLGVDPAEIEKLTAQQEQRDPEHEDGESLRRVRGLGRLGGEPAHGVDTTKLHGVSAIRAGLKA